MKERTKTIAALSLVALFVASRAWAVEYEFVTSVRIGQSPEKQVRIKLEPGKVANFDVGDGFILKLQVGPDQGNNTETSARLVRTVNDVKSIAEFRHIGPASTPTRATLFYCSNIRGSMEMPPPPGAPNIDLSGCAIQITKPL